MPGGWDGIGLAPELVDAVSGLGWLFPRDVQDEAIPLFLGGGDVMVAAATGSGKTGAFGLPIIQTILEQRRYESRPAPEVDYSDAAAAAKVAAAPLVLSRADCNAEAAVADDGLGCRAKHPRFWGGARASKSLKGGRYYFEVSVVRGLCRVGFSTADATLDLGIDAGGFGYGGTAKKSNKKRFEPYGEKYGDGDVLGCYADLERKEISFSKNGAALGVAFKLPKTFADPLFPAVCLKNAEVRVNFGGNGKAFEFPPASGSGFAAAADVKPEHMGTAEDNNRVRSRRAAAATQARHKTPVAIVVAPTKELAAQIHDDIRMYAGCCRDPAITSVLLMGGVNLKAAESVLQRGCDIVVGTPGRVLDFAKSRKLNVGNVATFCLDEADQLCDHETQKVILQLFGMLPKGLAGLERLQVCFFSATLHSPEITQLAAQICHNPTWVDLKGNDTVPDTVHHVFIPVDPAVPAARAAGWATAVPPHVVTDGVHTKDSSVKAGVDELALSEGVKRLKPLLLKRVVDEFKMTQCIIFCRTNLDCDNLEKFLIAEGGGKPFRAGAKINLNKYSCCVLAGMRDDRERRANLDAFKQGECRFLIATDVAARGIDVKQLPYVINYTLPDKPENYIHRIGRVGRAEHVGLAISLVATVKEKVWYYDKKKWKGKKLSTQLASIDRNGTPTGNGCCTWYNEPDLWRRIEALVGSKIPAVVTDSATGSLRLPPEVEAKLKSGASFGEQVGGDGFAEAVSAHISELQAPVERLTQMEVQAQSAFLHMAAGGFY